MYYSIAVVHLQFDGTDVRDRSDGVAKSSYSLRGDMFQGMWNEIAFANDIVWEAQLSTFTWNESVPKSR
jgi:hypothetical protein